MRCVVFVLAALLAMLPADNADLDVITLGGQECGLVGKPGGSPAQQDLNRHKNRYQIPGDDDIDPNVSLAAMLAPGNDVNRFDTEKAATIQGFVINAKVGGKESCNCEATNINDRDTHIELSLAEDALETQRVIVEVTPRLRMLKAKDNIDWKTPTLKESYKGKWVEVTGWLLFDSAHITQAENTHPGNASNWRATCWEIHPVTSIKVLDDPPDGVADFQPNSLKALHRLHAAHVARTPKGKAAIAKLHETHLSKFSATERKEAEDEVKDRQKQK